MPRQSVRLQRKCRATKGRNPAKEQSDVPILEPPTAMSIATCSITAFHVEHTLWLFVELEMRFKSSCLG